MVRLAGQIDLSKNEAILDAATEVMAERGLAAPMEEIARRACVSKQTIYNHYGSKSELVRAIVTRRVHELTATLETPEGVADPVQALTGFARVLLSKVMETRGVSYLRMALLALDSMPEVGQALYEAGTLVTRAKLAAFLEMETKAGRLACPNPLQAADFFSGMVVGAHQSAALLGVLQRLKPSEINALAQEAAERFMRAYAP
jgi:TetR/AcrR family transcriptional repressor of mexJK operon